MSEFADLLTGWGLSVKSAQWISDLGFTLNDFKIAKLEELQFIFKELTKPEQIRFRSEVEKLQDLSQVHSLFEPLMEFFAVPPQADQSVIDLIESGGSSGPNIVAVELPIHEVSESVTPEKKRRIASPSTPALRKSPRTPKPREPLYQACPQSSKKKLFERTICSHESLEKVLSKDVKGQSVLNNYKTNQMLEEKEQTIVGNIIVTLELAEAEDKTITAPRFKELSKFIKRLFPTEDEIVWYSPFRPTSSGSNIPARGRLLQLYFNIRKTLIASETIKSKRPRSKSSKKSDNLKAAPSEDLKKKLEFLKTQSKPFKTILSHWSDSTEHRFETDKSLSIDEYFQLYPVLGTTEGYKLLLLDFNSKLGALEHSFFTNWPPFVTEFTGFVKVQKSYSTLISQQKINLSSEIDDDLATVNTARLLSLLINKATAKLTKEEVTEGFICIVKNEADVIIKTEERKKKFMKLGRTVQPYPIIVVNDAPCVTHSYVCVNSVIYSVSSPAVAIDTCFKIYNALNARYPAESKGAWQFIQKNIYNLQTEYDENLVEDRRVYRRFLEFKARQLS